MAEQWLYTSNGLGFGPVSSAELISLIKIGALRSDDLVRPASSPDWQPMSPAFRQLLPEQVNERASLSNIETPEERSSIPNKAGVLPIAPHLATPTSASPSEIATPETTAQSSTNAVEPANIGTATSSARTGAITAGVQQPAEGKSTRNSKWKAIGWSFRIALIWALIKFGGNSLPMVRFWDALNGKNPPLHMPTQLPPKSPQIPPHLPQKKPVHPRPMGTDSTSNSSPKPDVQSIGEPVSIGQTSHKFRVRMWHEYPSPLQNVSVSMNFGRRRLKGSDEGDESREVRFDIWRPGKSEAKQIEFDLSSVDDELSLCFEADIDSDNAQHAHFSKIWHGGRWF